MSNTAIKCFILMALNSHKLSIKKKLARKVLFDHKRKTWCIAFKFVAPLINNY